MAVTASTTNPLRGKKRWAYLTRQKTIRLASTNGDGSLYLTPLWFVVDDERIYLPLEAGMAPTPRPAARWRVWSTPGTSSSL